MADIMMVSGEGDDGAGHTMIREAVGFGAASVQYYQRVRTSSEEI